MEFAKYKNPDEPKTVISNWMSFYSTIDFLATWEKFYNPNFNRMEFQSFRSESGRLAMTPKQWSCKIWEFIISYLTFLLGISTGIWSIYLIRFPLMDVVGYSAWSVFITLVVLRYVAIVTAIVFGVVIGARLISKKRKR